MTDTDKRAAQKLSGYLDIQLASDERIMMVCEGTFLMLRARFAVCVDCIIQALRGVRS